MTDLRTPTEEPVAVATAPAASTLGETDVTLSRRPGRWIDGWDAENTSFWKREGRAIASRNLKWSIFAEFLGFIVWQLWSIVVVFLPAAGFQLDTSQIFWLISMPSLAGATLRIPYTFMVPKFGGRNWTMISAALLLIPTSALAICVGDPETPFGVLLAVSALAGFGGGNFASSMSNITYFFPQREKGWALGLNAAGGNLGVSVAQFVVPIVVVMAAGATVNLPLAGWIWIPLILVAIFGAHRYMDNLSAAKADFAGSIAAVREPHMWLLALLYIGTFGSFIGFAGVFPKLIADQFPDFSSFQVGTASISLAFLGALVGSLSRPFGGRLADRFGGAKVTVASFGTMALGTLLVIGTLPLGSFWLFLLAFMVLFIASGIGNGSTYRMIPTVFAARAGTANAHTTGGSVTVQRKTAAALGLISAIGAYGGFLIPQALGLSKATNGDYVVGFLCFVASYVVMLSLTAIFYLRRGVGADGQRV
jgi:NNP family nitrate/nitrite transporter-like MFS transporter